MKLIDPPFKSCNEILETIIHFTTNKESIENDIVFKAINKTPAYLKAAVEYLKQIKIITATNNQLRIENDYKIDDASLYIPNTMIKKAITDFEPFKEYIKLIYEGKKESTAIKFVKVTYDISSDLNSIKTIFDKKIKFLETNIHRIVATPNRLSKIPNENNFFWINEEGHLVYDEKAHTQKIINDIESKRYKNPAFVDQVRIESLRKISNEKFDLSKLIKICEEINDAYRIENYFTVGVLTRVILDHVSPIFSKKNFVEIANTHGSKSFRDVMYSLENFTRKIADGILHTHIRKREFLPNKTTVDCRNGLDVLLGEIMNEIE